MIKILLVSIVIMLSNIGQAQENTRVPYHYVSIATDTLISKQKLLNGFRLCISDTNYKVVSFTLCFGCADSVCCIDNIGPEFDTTATLFKTMVRKIDIRYRVSIENIVTTIEGRRVKWPGLDLRVVE